MLNINRCPRCRRGKIFSSDNLFALNFSGMQIRCSECGLNYNAEQGFYWGAMYVSYGLTILESLITYILARLSGMEFHDYKILIPIFLTIALLAPFNFRLSRLIWLHLFLKRY